jgi:hypothetical protein
MRNLKIAGLILGACLAMTVSASAAGRFRGGIVIAPAYGAWGWYDPFFYGGPYGVYPSVYSNTGLVELKTNVKDADVFINGAYAGKADKLKSMWLHPDAYSLEIRTPGRAPFATQIYVVPGKTIKVHADFPPLPQS